MLQLPGPGIIMYLGAKVSLMGEKKWGETLREMSLRQRVKDGFKMMRKTACGDLCSNYCIKVVFSVITV
jgi:hypothetical protein